MNFDLYFLKETIPIILIFILISAKIMFGKKFNNWAFWILLSVCLIYTIFVLSVAMYMVFSLQGEIKPTIIQKINSFVGPFMFELYKFLNYVLAIMLIISSVGSIIYYQKTKNKDIFKRYLINCLIILFLFIGGYPVYFLSKNDKFEPYQALEISTNMSIIPGLKGFLASITSLEIDRKINSLIYNQKVPDYSSNEIQNLVKKSQKYSNLYAKLNGNSNFLILYLNSLRYRDCDTAEYAINQIKNKGLKNPEKYYAEISICRGDYYKALKYANQIKLTDNTSKKSKFWLTVKILIKLKKYDLALNILQNAPEQFKEHSSYYRAMIFIYYKKGRADISSQYFEILKRGKYAPQYIHKYNTLPEFIEHIDNFNLII